MVARRWSRRTTSTRRPIETLVQDARLVKERQERIVKAATRVFIARGYQRATVREIAAAAGLSLGSLYSYIKTKEDILYLVFEKVTTILQESTQRAMDGIEHPVEQIRATLDAILRTTQEYQDEILLLYQESKSLELESLRTVLDREADYVQFLEEILRRAADRDALACDPRLAADIIAYLCSIVALRRWNLRQRFARREVVDGLVAFILRGLGAVPPQSART